MFSGLTNLGSSSGSSGGGGMSSGPERYALMSGVGSMAADAGIVIGSGEDIQFHKRQGGILERRETQTQGEKRERRRAVA
mmetsp:Transcript_10265/g.18525  ORF Transcript_10265/g.18525 Transcript_10265/m.18525 type:complete len:80 (-) Transcript_10265:70-309(-)